MRPDIEFLLLFGAFTFLVGFVLRGGLNEQRLRRQFQRGKQAGYAEAILYLAPEPIEKESAILRRIK